ncbi:MAG: RNA polymerase sigma factor [Pseudomonadota bacterium]
MTADFNAHEAIRTLYPRLWRFCLATTGSRVNADDLAQAACLRALERIHQFKPGTAFDAWVFRIGKNVWINELRANAVRRGGGLVPLEDAEPEDRGHTPESNLSGSEVLDTLMQLPEAQRITAYLAYVEGYSYKETASMLDIPIGTVMSRLSAARKRLSSRLRADYPTAQVGQPT